MPVGSYARQWRRIRAPGEGVSVWDDRADKYGKYVARLSQLRRNSELNVKKPPNSVAQCGIWRAMPPEATRVFLRIFCVVVYWGGVMRFGRRWLRLGCVAVVAVGMVVSFAGAAFAQPAAGLLLGDSGPTTGGTFIDIVGSGLNGATSSLAAYSHLLFGLAGTAAVRAP